VGEGAVGEQVEVLDEPVARDRAVRQAGREVEGPARFARSTCRSATARSSLEDQPSTGLCVTGSRVRRSRSYQGS